MLTMSYLPAQVRQRRAVVAALVGADRQRARDLGQHAVLPGRQRLLDQRHAQAHQMRGEVGIDLGRPAFVGVDDDACVRGAPAPHGLEPRHVVGRAELDLQERAVRVQGRLPPASLLGRVERQGDRR